MHEIRNDSRLHSVRAVPIYTEIDKVARAWKLSAFFERGQVFLLPTMTEMIQHLLKMPSGRYKDLFDALDIAINLAFNYKKKKRNYEPGLI